MTNQAIDILTTMIEEINERPNKDSFDRSAHSLVSTFLIEARDRISKLPDDRYVHKISWQTVARDIGVPEEKIKEDCVKLGQDYIPPALPKSDDEISLSQEQIKAIQKGKNFYIVNAKKSPISFGYDLFIKSSDKVLVVGIDEKTGKQIADFTQLPQ